MSYKINTTNQPDGSPLVEVDDAEFIDLQRMGLIRANAGDINDKGELKKTIDAPPEVRNVTASIPTPGALASSVTEGGQ
jgi:hypothetical protein